jgi:hypothetical protein
MRFAKVVFGLAGIWGVLTLTPLYFIYDTIGRQDPPAINHPGFYYGFAGVGLAWQFVFFVIASNPLRFRTMMIPAVLAKIGFGAPSIVLYLERRLSAGDMALGCIDLLLGGLFVIAFGATGVAHSDPTLAYGNDLTRAKDAP